MNEKEPSKRRSKENIIEDDCQSPEKKRMAIDDDIIILEDDDKKVEDEETARQKFTKKCLLYIKKRKGDITKMTHRELIGIFVEKFVETFTFNSTIQRLKRELDDAHRTIDLLKDQNRSMSKSVTQFDEVLKRLNADLKTRTGYIRPYVIQRSVGLQISSNSQCNINPPESKSRNDPEHFNENELASNSEQNDRITTKQIETTDSPETNVEMNKDTEDENIGLDDWRSDESAPGSPEQIAELDQQNSENEEPTEERIVDEEMLDNAPNLPIEYLDSDEESSFSDTEFEIFKQTTVIANPNETADVSPEISVDDLGEVTVDEVIRVLSSCGLINPDENEIVSDSELLNDLEKNEKSKEIVDAVLSVSCPKLIEFDSNQNILQTELCDKTDSVCEVDTSPQAGPSLVSEVQDVSENSEPTPDEKKLKEKENVQPLTNQQGAAEASVNQLPAPSLCGIKEGLDAVLTWAMPDGINHETIASFEILYAFDELKNKRFEWSWKPIGVIENSDYPVMCKLGKFQAGRNYCFTVRAVDKDKRFSPYSNVYKVEF